jgi:hypothetical protein
MQQHLNQQHSIKLTRWTSLSATSYSNHAAQLWKPVKAQTFFRERRYLRYFVVQQQQEEVKEKEEEQEQEQNNTQSKQIDVQQRTASLSSQLEAIQARDSQATACILEEATAHDRTGWFKRTGWEEHLQAYPDWRLLAYAVRLPSDDEPELQRVVRRVEEVLEQSVQGLYSLSHDTRRWMRSARLQRPDIRPLGRMQQPESQRRAARYWARLICYCLRIVAAEEVEEGKEVEQAEEAEQEPPSQPRAAIKALTHLFPWHGRQKTEAVKLWRLLTNHTLSADIAQEEQSVVLCLSQSLICQDIYHQPFHSGLIHFLAALAINPDINRLRDAPQFASLLSSIIYCVRVLTTESCLPSTLRAEQGAAETIALLQQRARYLVDGSHSPMSVMISLLAYAKHISLYTPSSIAGSIRWSHDQQTLYLKSHAIKLERFQAMVQEIVVSAERLLWDELLWTTVKQRQQRLVDLTAIQDDTTVRCRGASFLSPALQEEGKRWMLAQLASTPAAQRLYKQRQQQETQENQRSELGEGRSSSSSSSRTIVIY